MVVLDGFLIKEFEDYLSNKNLSDSSKKMYSSVIKTFLKENKSDLNDLEAYNNFIVEKAIKGKATNYYYAIEHFIKFYIKDNSTRNNILNGLQKPKQHAVKKKGKLLNMKQLIKLANSLRKEKHRVMAYIMMYTGIRIGDCLNIMREDVNITNDKVTIHLSGKGSKLNVPTIYKKEVIEMIKKFMDKYNYGIEDKDKHYLFLEGKTSTRATAGVRVNKSLRGNKIKLLSNEVVDGKKEGDIIDISNVDNNILELIKDYIMKGDAEWYDNKRFILKDYFKLRQSNYLWFWQDLKMAVQTLGLNINDFSCHDFRRCYATMIYSKTKDISLLKKMLNHARLDTSLLYVQQSGLDRQENDRFIQQEILT